MIIDEIQLSYCYNIILYKLVNVTKTTQTLITIEKAFHVGILSLMQIIS